MTELNKLLMQFDDTRIAAWTKMVDAKRDAAKEKVSDSAGIFQHFVSPPHIRITIEHVTTFFAKLNELGTLDSQRTSLMHGGESGRVTGTHSERMICS